MKLSYSYQFVEIYTKSRTYVYPVTSVFSRIDAVDFAVSRHKEHHPEDSIESVLYSSKASYLL